jgi:hypothetical protein
MVWRLDLGIEAHPIHRAWSAMPVDGGGREIAAARRSGAAESRLAVG